MSKFDEFLSRIRPSPELLEKCRTAHERLRADVMEFERTKEVTIGQFLQGSYRRSTLIAPIKDELVDVDLINVTTLPESIPPRDVLARFKEMLTAKRGPPGEAWKENARSLNIKEEDVELDLVITSAPTMMDYSIAAKAVQGAYIEQLENAFEAAFRGESVSGNALAKAIGSSWKDEPLKIPDRMTETWEATHPIQQIQLHFQRQRECNGHLNDVVRAMKYWKYRGYLNEELPKRPRGYPWERLVYEYCPAGIASAEEGVLLTTEGLVEEYLPRVRDGDFALADLGVPENDVMKHVEPQDLLTVLGALEASLPLLRKAVLYRKRGEHQLADECWRAFFGTDAYPGPDASRNDRDDDFPPPTPPKGPARPPTRRYA